MKTLAILQARVSSSRLPGKVLRLIVGQPMLARQIERVKRATRLDGIVVATSNRPDDDAVQALCEEMNVPCFRGSLDDVLDRYYQAARPYAPAHVVRLTGDCPLTDPALIDEIVDLHIGGDFDYTSNCHPPTFPDGLDVEVVRFSVLEAAWREADLPSEREHVMPFVWRRPDRFSLGNFSNPAGDLSALRWTVDEPADFDLVSRIYEAIYPSHPNFGTADILTLLQEHPELETLNTHHERNEGLQKSIEQDTLFKKGAGKA